MAGVGIPPVKLGRGNQKNPHDQMGRGRIKLTGRGEPSPKGWPFETLKTRSKQKEGI